ncbi:MAG: hypothetical protein LBQ33_06920 [Oscillospiraceae bacterium]|jgi:hypothetical protein|nr:hypothetical protein [Oscillospiraceae bacterium]
MYSNNCSCSCQPGSAYPGYPGGVYPGYPGGLYPGYPGGCYPGYPGGTYPGYPGGTYPGYPGGCYPGYPGGTYPGYPGGYYPGYPGGGCCCDPSADAASCPHNPLLDYSAVYGGMYRSDEFNFELLSGTTNYLLQMDSPLPLKNVGFTPSTLTIQCSGTYELTFFGNFSYSGDAAMNFYVKANGKKIEESEVILNAIPGQLQSFERTVIVHLPANTSLQAFLDTTEAGELYSPENGIHLEVRRIGA